MYDFVGPRQHVLTVDIDKRTQRMDAVAALDPSRESVGVALHLRSSFAFISGVPSILAKVSVNCL